MRSRNSENPSTFEPAILATSLVLVSCKIWSFCGPELSYSSLAGVVAGLFLSFLRGEDFVPFLWCMVGYCGAVLRTCALCQPVLDGKITSSSNYSEKTSLPTKNRLFRRET